MALDEVGSRWFYPTNETSMDRRTSRVGVKKPFSAALTGVDGSLEGHLRPHPGFLTAKQFSPSAWETAVIAARVEDGLSGGSGYHDKSSDIIDIFPVNFVIGEDGYGYGFVYRVRRKGASTSVEATASDIFIEYWNSKLYEAGTSASASWVGPKCVSYGQALSSTESTNGRQMSVSVWGRYIYVFVEGATNGVVVVSCERSSPWGFQREGNVGPGRPPLLIDPEDSPAFNSITTLPTGTPGSAQVWLQDSTGSTGYPDWLQDAANGGPVWSATDAPQDTDAVTALEPGDYAFAYYLYDSRSGRRSALSNVAQARIYDFRPDPVGNPTVYAWMYAYLEICYDKTKNYDQAYVYRSVRVQDAGGTYIAGILHLDGIIDLGTYESVEATASPSTIGHAVYCYSLQDKQLPVQPTFNDNVQFDEKVPKAGASFWYENTMLLSKIRGQTTSLSNGAQIRRFDSVQGMGEMRYSSLVDISPELFPPSNRWIPDLKSSEITVFRKAGANIVGFSRDRQYAVRKYGTDIKVQPQHEGYGVVNERCAESTGSMIYFLGHKGLKSVDENGQLDDVRSINQIIQEDWASYLKYCSMSYDPVTSTLSVLRGDRLSGEMVQFWFNTARVTQLRDVPFSLTARGSWPDGLNSTTAGTAEPYTLVERSFFVQNSPKSEANESLSDWAGPRVLIMDHKREKTQTAGSQTSGTVVQRLLPHTGDSVFTVSSVSTSAGHIVSVTVSTAGGKSLGTSVVGCKLYIISSSTPTRIGLKATIKSSATGGVNLWTLGFSTDKDNLLGIAAGDIVGISPVYFEWQGSPLNSETASEQSQDQSGAVGGGAYFFRVKHVDSIGCCFMDVSGVYSGNNAAMFQALAYRGSDSTPDGIAYTRKTDGTLVCSITDLEGIYYAAFTDNASTTAESKRGIDGAILTPGVRILCPDVDYRLVGVLVTGDLRATLRTRRASIP